ncbi:MAG: response regulator [Verrucomicrobia bacterium]|nr:response regulator [Verrucomicrobiota bacterium]
MKRVFTPAKQKTILIVDDDLVADQLYREKFQGRGFKVEIAADGHSAGERLKASDVDLVIVDLCLPGTNVIELVKSTRSSAPSLPIIAFSNPYLGSLRRAATEAGATKCIPKRETTPDQMVDLARELGVVSTTRSVTVNEAETFETNRRNFAAQLLMNGPEAIVKLRAGYQAFARAQEAELRRAELGQMQRLLRLLTGGASLVGFEKIARMSRALEALLFELQAKPEKITPSVIRTVGQTVDTLASLFVGAANPRPEVDVPPKILVVDDEVISREMICSALGRVGLEAISKDDPLAAQQLLEREHVDLIFLDVEMPGQSGLELCKRIRGTDLNRATPVVFVTSHSDFGSRAQSTLSGGNDFIAKPFLLVELAVKALTLLFKESASSPSPTK